jgi:hypothetical protein
MEVHHHPKPEKKPFKEYFLEFLMIFLAVTMGFFAENLREKIVNHETEKAFMESLVQDLKDDKLNVAQQQQVFDQRVVLLDSLIMMLDATPVTANTNDLYYYARLATKSPSFTGNTRTIDQMKSTGGFKLIRNKKVTEAMLAYYAIIEQIKHLEFDDGELSEMNEYRKIAVQVFNADVFNRINSTGLNIVSRPGENPPLRTNDPKLRGDLAGWVHYIKNTRIGIYQYKNDLLKKGEELIRLIGEEYHVD